MAEESKIQWTEATWNPWHGCKKVSPGCKYCYMYRDKERYGHDPTTVLRSKSKFNEPLKWKEPKLIFTCSWSDFFIEEADEWRKDAWEVIRNTPQHTYQILTKRPERIKDHLPEDWGEGYDNVWLGVSVENQKTLHPRIWYLCHVPAKVRFISFEPLLGFISFASNAYISDSERNPMYEKGKIKDLIHWAIIGGESGNETGKYRYRECYVEWIQALITELRYAKIPVFVKQMGTHIAKDAGLKDRHGGNMEEWFQFLKIREMPEYYEATKSQHIPK